MWHLEAIDASLGNYLCVSAYQSMQRVPDVYLMKNDLDVDASSRQ